MDPNAIPEMIVLMDRQRASAFATLDDVSEEELWHRPEPGEWSIGEILAHVERFNRSFMPLLHVAWALGWPLARIWRDRPYEIAYHDPYRLPNFPMSVGWMWSPRRAARDKPSRDELERQIKVTHDRLRAFYAYRDPRLLGHIKGWDPAIGVVNLIQSLRVMLYHDELHYEDVRRMGRQASE